MQVLSANPGTEGISATQIARAMIKQEGYFPNCPAHCKSYRIGSKAVSRLRVCKAFVQEAGNGNAFIGLEMEIMMQPLLQALEHSGMDVWHACCKLHQEQQSHGFCTRVSNRTCILLSYRVVSLSHVIEHFGLTQRSLVNTRIRQFECVTTAE